MAYLIIYFNNSIAIILFLHYISIYYVINVNLIESDLIYLLIILQCYQSRLYKSRKELNGRNIEILVVVHRFKIIENHCRRICRQYRTLTIR